MLKKLLVLCYTVVLVTCGDERSGSARKSRFITFDTENNEIGVSLDFSVPFMSIPMKKASHPTFGSQLGFGIPLINFNPSALAFGGFMTLATNLFLPLFSKGLDIFNTDRYYRVLDSETDETNILANLGNKFMSVSRGCPLSIACWVSQKSSDGETRRTLDQIMRNKLFSSFMNVTAIGEAIRHGRKGYDCSTYEPCPIREEYLPVLMSNFAMFSNSMNTT